MYTVLLVDDERWVRVALRRVIERTGLPFEVVHECTNGLDALDWLKSHKADLVLADIKMPVMDGLALVEQLRQMGGNQDVIIVSGHDDFRYAQTAIRSGVTDYMLKPVEEEDMKKSLDKWIQKQAAAKDKSADQTMQPADEMSQSAIQRVIRIIQEAKPGQITLKDAAAKVHLNPSYLSQLFKQQTGKTFSDYVNEVRLEEAKKLLVHTALRVSEVSERLGYTDLTYFSGSFKKLTGHTPSEYRKKFTKDSGSTNQFA
jgi:YesN/AraC family two-component response regulator